MDDQTWWEDALEPSGDPGHSAERQPWERGYSRSFGTPDAARLGLDRNTLEGAQLHFLSHFDSSRLTHRIAAWVLLVLIAGPIVVRVLDLLTGG